MPPAFWRQKRSGCRKGGRRKIGERQIDRAFDVAKPVHGRAPGIQHHDPLLVHHLEEGILLEPSRLPLLVGRIDNFLESGVVDETIRNRLLSRKDRRGEGQREGGEKKKRVNFHAPNLARKGEPDVSAEGKICKRIVILSKPSPAAAVGRALSEVEGVVLALSKDL